MAPQRLYTLPELAEITGRSYDLFDEACRRGELRYIRPGGEHGTRYVAERDYDAWFEAQLSDVAAPEPRVPGRRAERLELS